MSEKNLSEGPYTIDSTLSVREALPPEQRELDTPDPAPEAAAAAIEAGTIGGVPGHAAWDVPFRGSGVYISPISCSGIGVLNANLTEPIFPKRPE